MSETEELEGENWDLMLLWAEGEWGLASMVQRMHSQFRKRM